MKACDLNGSALIEAASLPRREIFIVRRRFPVLTPTDRRLSMLRVFSLALLLFTIPGLAQASGYGQVSSCGQALSSRGYEREASSFSDQIVRSVPELKMMAQAGPATRPHIVIPSEIIAEVDEEMTGSCNQTPWALAVERATRLISVPNAETARDRILGAIAESARAARAGDLAAAMAPLADRELLRDSGFRWVADCRYHYEPLLALARTEREFVLRVLALPSYRPRLNYGGTVHFSAPPQFDVSNEKSAWVVREWIRTAAEELGHLAQILTERVDPSRSTISRLMTDPRSAFVRSAVFNEGENLSAGSVWFRRIHHLHEADVYAFLVEQYGPEFVPTWYAEDSGYTLRQYVDAEFTRQGFPLRAWTRDEDVSTAPEVCQRSRKRARPDSSATRAIRRVDAPVVAAGAF